MNVALLLDMAADALPDRVAVGATTFAGLREQARAVARSVVAAGVPRLVLAGENSAAVPALLFGAAQAGVPFTALNYRLADDRLRALLARCAPAALVADPDCVARIGAVPGVEPLAAPHAAADLPEPDPTGDTTAIALFTSGTTGEPKRVLLRHRNVFSYVVGTLEFASAGPDEAALVSVPAYHIAGLAAILSNTYQGRRLVYLPRFEADAWVATAAAERITHAMIVPTMLGRILDELEATGTSLPALRQLSYGGGRMPLETVRRALQLLPYVGFVNAYGLTETSSTVALLTPADHRTAIASDDPVVSARLGSVGRAVPGVELEVRAEDGRPAPIGSLGAVWVRGEQVGGEYDDRSALDADGWFSSNDLGRLDEAGYLFLEGRADDVIVRGGENLSPGEIEEVLGSHPAVVEVAVVAVPDPEWGESPAAFVVLDKPATATDVELQAWVRNRLRSSRVPTLVLRVDGLPYSETGKLLRRVLRAEAVQAVTR